MENGSSSYISEMEKTKINYIDLRIKLDDEEYAEELDRFIKHNEKIIKLWVSYNTQTNDTISVMDLIRGFNNDKTMVNDFVNKNSEPEMIKNFIEKVKSKINKDIENNIRSKSKYNEKSDSEITRKTNLSHEILELDLEYKFNEFLEQEKLELESL
jgi:hypothetical protein